MRTGIRRRIVVALMLAVLASAAGWRLRDVLAQDACLDAGGAWREGACRH
ncbi:hypothetical protein ABS772_02150 [Methylorubrum podarium]|uniref:Uncharacterized protein n=1 Tax=Methylorubrum podarium TaxID=200476 RepID=A0ABV1QH45_9HYPH